MFKCPSCGSAHSTIVPMGGTDYRCPTCSSVHAINEWNPAPPPVIVPRGGRKLPIVLTSAALLIIVAIIGIAAASTADWNGAHAPLASPVDQTEQSVAQPSPNANEALGTLTEETAASTVETASGEPEQSQDWPKKLIEQVYGSTAFVDERQLSQVSGLWRLARSKYTGVSNEEQIYDAAIYVLQGRRYFPDLELNHVLNYLIDKGIGPGATPAVSNTGATPTVTDVAQTVLAQLENEFTSRHQSASESAAAMAENIARNKANAQQRGQSRNSRTATIMENQRADQLNRQTQIQTKGRIEHAEGYRVKSRP